MWTPRFIDSHTGGEPTRLVLDPPEELLALAPAERGPSLAGALARLRAAVIGEPRTSDATVGAFLLPAEDPACRGALLFFNDIGALGTCIHGTIGAVASLAHRGDLAAGTHRFETPAGTMTATLGEDGSVSVESVPCRRAAEAVAVPTEAGPVEGDIVYGGNWFLHVDPSPLAIAADDRGVLLALARTIRRGVDAADLRGDDGAPVDHIGLFERLDPELEGAHARNFVLCPGGAHDRSPCGTGTAAWLAGCHLDGQLEEGETWTVESAVGSRFEGSVARARDGSIVPTIRGRASVVAEGRLHLDPEDIFPEGIPR